METVGKREAKALRFLSQKQYDGYRVPSWQKPATMMCLKCKGLVQEVWDDHRGGTCWELTEAGRAQIISD